MAGSGTPQGYKCQFLDSVPEDLYCKQCHLVARKLTITSCCGESYCNGCILFIQQDNKPCPECGKVEFDICPNVKSQKKVLLLKAYCPFKERGCQWCDKLEHLEAHLHPDEGDCDYADVNCPLKCNQLVDRKDLTNHTANECVKRDFICPYCAFKATYEIVSTVHWSECRYYPLPCPNRCGVTCERPTMEDHIKICPLELVDCVFQHVGCAGKYRREEEEEHMREKSQTHLTMMAAASAKMKQEFQEKLQEQEAKLKEQEKRIEEQKKWFQARLQEQDKKFQEELLMQKKEFESNLKEKEMNFENNTLRLQREYFEERLQVQQKAIEEIKEEVAKKKLEKKIETQLPILPSVPQQFTLYDFKGVRRSGDEWKSPVMYTHAHGYKFCVGIDLSGVNVKLLAITGEYDDQLKWPAKARFTIELVNYRGGNQAVSLTVTWSKPTGDYEIMRNTKYSWFGADGDILISTSKLTKDEPEMKYVENNTLLFKIVEFTPLP